jgi:hypothetical protein
MVVRCCSFTIATSKILAYFAHLFIIWNKHSEGIIIRLCVKVQNKPNSTRWLILVEEHKACKYASWSYRFPFSSLATQMSANFHFSWAVLSQWLRFVHLDVWGLEHLTDSSLNIWHAYQLAAWLQEPLRRL